MLTLPLRWQGMALTALAALSCVAAERPSTARAVAPVLESTYDFVVTDVAIDFPEATSRAGFNLDVLYSLAGQSSGCNHADHLSTASPLLHQNGCTPEQGNCIGGVDNVLPELVDLFENTTGQFFRPAASSHIQNGHAVLLLRVTDLDSLVSDPFVDVRVYHGFAKFTNCAEAFGGGGLFYVDNASLLTPGDLDTPRWQMQGSIVDGKLHVTNAWSLATAATMAIPLTVDLSSSSSFTAGVHQMSLFTSAAPLSGTAPFTVNFGGWLHTDTFSLALENALPNHATQIFQLMPNLSDLPNPTTGDCDTGTPLAQGGLSVGANLTLRSAVLYGTADTPPPNACGTSW